MEFKVGDEVIKSKNWEPNDFDLWGRGIGIGKIIDIDDNIIDVRWPAGICYEEENQIVKVEKQS